MVHDHLLGTTLAGRYRLDSLVGQGGMGRVYRARDGRLDRDVALKVLAEDLSHDEGAAQRFVREAKVLARLSHRHVLQVFDHGETEDGRLFLVTELLVGQSLAQLLDAQHDKRLSPRATAELIAQIAAGLDHVHSEGVIHRDLKPANVFLNSEDGQPRVKILDFGIARSGAPGTGTHSGLVGTPMYMSPEQFRGDRALDPRADLYSLGVIAYEALTGRAPFESQMALVRAHMGAPPPPLGRAFPAGALADELRALVEQLLARSASDRPASAREVRERLEAMLGAGCLQGAALAAPDLSRRGTTLVPSPPAPERGPRRRWAWLGLVAASVVAVVTVAASLAWERRSTCEVTPRAVRAVGRLDATPGRSALVHVPAGAFCMGSERHEVGRRADEALHVVTLTRDFWIGATEVTQAQWRAVMGTSPARFGGLPDSPARPVEQVSWFEALEYVNRLSREEGLSACYVLDGAAPGASVGCPLEDSWTFARPCTSDPGCRRVERVAGCAGYRLPTEAEWEYAARAGSRGALGERDLTIVGDAATSRFSPDLDGVAVCGANSRLGDPDAGRRGENCAAWDMPDAHGGARCATKAVCSQGRNALGLCDVLGNVWEWVEDRYHAGYGMDPVAAVRDPLVVATSSAPVDCTHEPDRVHRGGSYRSTARLCRMAMRDGLSPCHRNASIGLRVARDVAGR